MVGAGIILNIVTEWRLFKEIKPVISLVPALLGLKGNLEMTLASRLSTQVFYLKLTLISTALVDDVIIIIIIVIIIVVN